MSIIFNSVTAFVEQVGRRTTQRFGTMVNYVFVYTGPQSAFSSWVPKLGSNPQGYPLLYLNNAERRNMQANVCEATLFYIGTDQQAAVYTDLEVSTDLASKSWSWSGYAMIASAITPFIAQLSISFEYKTIEVTFSYTTYKYQNGALFESSAAQYTEVVIAYVTTTYGGVQEGVGPSVGPPYHPNLTLTRFTCEQMTPQNSNGSGVWKCSETWALDYNMGTLGFPNPQYTAAP